MFLVDAILVGVIEMHMAFPALQLQFDVTSVPNGATITAIAGVHSDATFAPVQPGWTLKSEQTRAGVKVAVYSRVKTALDSVVSLDTIGVHDYSLEGTAVAFHDTTALIGNPVIKHTGEENIGLLFGDLETNPYFSEQEVGEVNASNLILKAVFAKPDVMNIGYAANIQHAEPMYVYQPTAPENLTFDYALTRQNDPRVGNAYNFRFGGVTLKYTSEATAKNPRR